MSEIVRFKSEKYGDLLVEVDEPETMGLKRISAGNVGDKITDAAETFEEAVAPVLDHAKQILEALQKLAPSEAEIEFGIKLSAEAGAILAKAGGEANFGVTLSWKSN
jgi:Trypsin-co-occurring domain 1